MAQDGLIGILPYSVLIEKIGVNFSQGLQNDQNINVEEKKLDVVKPDYKLDDFLFVKRLGHVSILCQDSTAYGKILLVQNQKDNILYQMRTFVKNKIVEDNIEKQLEYYKGTLSQVQFPLLPDFMRSFKDQDYIYFLCSYVEGQSFYDVLREVGLLNLSDALFYVSCLVIILEYLHTKQIIHRDVRPSSFIVDKKGYIRANNLECAKIVQTGRTKTLIGAPHYIAPEVLSNKGYNYAVDLWSLGICVYEFVCGYVPYASKESDPILIYEEIIHSEQVQFPFFLHDKHIKDLINRLLSHIPERRLGGSYGVLKAHPFFDKMDWDKLLDQKCNSPYIPKPEQYEYQENADQDKKKHYLYELKKSDEQYSPDQARYKNWDAIY